jgi:transcriptional regulator GlxA family with amidase domain
MREARIKRACQLLRQTEKTVSEVAYACGFTDPKYFSRIFKQSIGQAPTEYRTGFSGV